MHPFSTLWKHQKTLCFSDVFGGWKNGALGTNGLININNYCTHFIKLAGWQLSWVVIGWMKIFPGGNYPVGSFPRWELSRLNLSWAGIFFWMKFSEWELSGGNHPCGIHVTSSISILIFNKTYNSLWYNRSCCYH